MKGMDPARLPPPEQLSVQLISFAEQRSLSEEDLQDTLTRRLTDGTNGRKSGGGDCNGGVEGGGGDGMPMHMGNWRLHANGAVGQT